MFHAFWHVDWPSLMLPELSWAEKIVRPLLVYMALLVVFRLANKRELAQATLFDFLIILLISNVVQNAMIGSDNSVLGAAAGAVTLVFLSGTLNRITSRNRRARVFLEGHPALLICHGEILENQMAAMHVSRNDLLSAIRKQGIGRLSEVGFAVLELDGSISVIRADDDHRPHDTLPVEIVGRQSAESGDG